MKVAAEHGSGGEALRESFKREAAILSRLDHPGLPRVSDFFELDDTSYLVMDYIAGQDLLAVLVEELERGRSIGVERIVRWADELCGVLAYLHGQRPPVIHRDVKPSNVKLTPDGQLRLVDFGLAGPIDHADADATITVRSGAGSRPYQPLEQYDDGPGVDTRADIYALGATLYHLVTGRAPHTARDRFLDPTGMPQVDGLRPDVPGPLATVIEDAMALHPDDRPPTVVEFRQRLVERPTTVAGASMEADDGWRAALRFNRWLVAVFIMLFLIALALSVLP